MIGLVVTGHGNFATGITSSVRLIAGQPDAYETVDFVEGEGVEELTAHLNEAFDKLKDTTDAVLVLSDLPGGSPFKTAVEVSVTRPDQKIVVIAGTNLPMIIETSMARAFVEELDSLTTMALNAGKDNVLKYEFVAHNVDDDDEIEIDGI